VEQRILPLARERGIGVIVNRPFREGALLRDCSATPAGLGGRVRLRQLGAVLLKFIVSHPAVTCAIPATSQVSHVRQNMAALRAAHARCGAARTHGRARGGAVVVGPGAAA
jgi:aryl-alcohol dehydrogenase-like predicted oxidoreductase